MFLTENINILLAGLFAVVLVIYRASRRTAPGAVQSSRRMDRLAIAILIASAVMLMAPLQEISLDYSLDNKARLLGYDLNPV